MVISDSFLASGPSGFCKPDVWEAWCYIAEKLSHVVKIFFFFRTFRLSMHFCLAINVKPTFTKVGSILCSRRCKIWRNSRLKSWCPRFRDVSKTDFDVSLSDLKVVIVILVLDNTKLSNSFSLKEWQRQTLFDLFKCIMNRGSTVFCFSTTRRQVRDMEPALATISQFGVSKNTCARRDKKKHIFFFFCHAKYTHEFALKKIVFLRYAWFYPDARTCFLKLRTSLFSTSSCRLL